MPDLQKVQDALETVLLWHSEAPIEEMEAVEAAIERNFPQLVLEEALSEVTLMMRQHQK